MIKQMPKSLDAEKALLGSLIMYPESIRIAFDNDLQKDQFYSNSNQIVYEAIMSLEDEKKPVDITSVVTRMTDMGTLEVAGGTDYLIQLVDLSIAPASVDYYIELVQGKAVLRELVKTAQAIAEEGMDRSFELDEVLDDAERKILDVTRNRKTSDFRTSKEVVTTVLDQLKAIQSHDGITGIPSNFNDLDRITNGFQNSDLIILAARPAVGKTAFALNLALNASLLYDKHVAIFSLEMPAEQLIKRMMAAQAGVEAGKLRNAHLTNQEWNMLYEASEQLKQCHLYIGDSSGVKVSEIFSKCRKLKADGKLDMIIIDYLQLITGGKNIESRQQEVSEISRSLKILARELNVPVLALSQLSRDVEKRGKDSQPVLSDLRESGSIEQDADIVMFLHRNFSNEDPQNKPAIREITVIIAKHRNGAIGDVKLTFETSYSRFSNYIGEGAVPDEF